MGITYVHRKFEYGLYNNFKDNKTQISLTIWTCISTVFIFSETFQWAEYFCEVFYQLLLFALQIALNYISFSL